LPLGDIVYDVSDNDGLERQGWSPADLEANRAGKLSDEQLAVLRARNRSYLRRAFAFTLPLPVASLAFAIFATIAWNIPQLFVLPIIGTIAVSIVVGFVGSRVRAVGADLASGRVDSASGKIDGYFVNTANGQARLRIGTTRIESFGPQSDRRWREVRVVLREADKNGHEVRAYYLPSSRLLVAGELLTRSSE
jgi:hypothetical protein